MAYTKNASEIVKSFINEKIAAGFWKSGDKIWTEAKLSECLGISRTAIRQAVDSMVEENILRRVQGSGTYLNSAVVDLGISEPSDADVLDILEFRRYFEYGNVLMFMENHDEEDIRELAAHYDRMCNAGDDRELFYSEDYLFHNTLARGTKKKFIANISSALNSVLLNTQHSVNRIIGPQVGIEYHYYILHYIEAGDAKLAAMYMQRHIDATIAKIKEELARRDEQHEPAGASEKGKKK